MSYGKNKQDVIGKEGHWVIAPIHLEKVLTEHESSVLRLIQYEQNIGTKYISNSLFGLETGIMRDHTLATIKKNLEKLNFIEVVEVNRTKGTHFKVLCRNIAEVVGRLNDEPNAVNRLRIADEYRTEKGLESILKSRIEKYENTTFDNQTESDRFVYIDDTETPKAPKEPQQPKEVKQLNDWFYMFQNGEINEKEYNRKQRVYLYTISDKITYKIIFDKNTNQWKKQTTNMN